jgi:hypothetical protein
MPLVILHNLLNVSVQLANKRGLKKILYLQIRRTNTQFQLVSDLSEHPVDRTGFVVAVNQ